MSSVVYVEMHWIWSYTVSMGFHQLHLFGGLPSASFQEKVSEQRSLFAVCSSARTCGKLKVWIKTIIWYHSWYIYIYFELQLATSRMICVPEERYDICSYQRNSILYFFHYSYVINHIHRMYTRPKINSVSRTQKVIQKKQLKSSNTNFMLKFASWHMSPQQSPRCLFQALHGWVEGQVKIGPHGGVRDGMLKSYREFQGNSGNLMGIYCTPPKTLKQFGPEFLAIQKGTGSPSNHQGSGAIC